MSGWRTGEGLGTKCQATAGLHNIPQKILRKATSGNTRHMPGIVSVAVGQESKICSDSYKSQARSVTGKVVIGLGFP